MNVPTPGHLTDRRKELSEKIARQRTELAVAYRGLIKPFQYADTSVAALKVIRKNGWILGMAPSAVSLAFSFLGWEKKSKPGLLARLKQRARPKAETLEEELPPKLKKPLRKLAGHAWSLFQVYRKVRPYFP